MNKAVVGDFLQSGGKQLLLLFDRGSPSTECLLSPDRYLLTDLQGWVVDRRQGEEEPLSQESGQEGERSENLQRVVAALQEQNQVCVHDIALKICWFDKCRHRRQLKEGNLHDCLICFPHSKSN